MPGRRVERITSSWAPQMSEYRYLDKRLENQITWYSDKADHCQWVHKRMKAAEVILAAMVPFILATDIMYAKWIASFCGAAIAVLSGVHSLGKYHENWIEYRSVSETLKHEKYLYLTKSGAYSDSVGSYHRLVERVESIISHENINWSQVHRCDDTG